MKAEQLAVRCRSISKGHLSDVEHGFTRPTVATPAELARHLGVLPLDLVTFPAEDERQRLLDQTRGLSAAEIKRLLGTIGPQRAKGK